MAQGESVVKIADINLLEMLGKGQSTVLTGQDWIRRRDLP